RVQCKNNLHQIGLALHNYHDVYGVFPASEFHHAGFLAPVRQGDWGSSLRSNWIIATMPFADQAPLFNTYDSTIRYDQAGPNRELWGQKLPYMICPSNPVGNAKHANQFHIVHYAGVWGSENPPGGRARSRTG
ncbi:MAG TPA: DUF1559 domain-containing protein, partial [Fuerstia sp.]|nr:DUF1559 domain-containing protein [Fuerstiella sp.]